MAEAQHALLIPYHRDSEDHEVHHVATWEGWHLPSDGFHLVETA